ncbi:hypothetical protein SPSYN_01105 [Sporotomaculum syntrophicum]|uniref:Integrase core domain protein n=1 Tax=Sporotomaculum syntrophicum TaxID=182264 RepID=A0A9D2WPC3_9FIRM|nr:transposase [Sporotomaculum syntrophicum]KAF1084969.1 hypothetical protein SPSYN_01105 [Sporotomaculum syntrophicum]
MTFVEPATGELKSAHLFVAVLPASAYPFDAYSDTKLFNWLDAHERAYEYFGGVPKVTIPDNTKTAVTTPDLFDPVLNKSYSEMARCYGITIVPARSRIKAHPASACSSCRYVVIAAPGASAAPLQVERDNVPRTLYAVVACPLRGSCRCCVPFWQQRAVAINLGHYLNKRSCALVATLLREWSGMPQYDQKKAP